MGGFDSAFFIIIKGARFVHLANDWPATARRLWHLNGDDFEEAVEFLEVAGVARVER